MEVIRSNHMVFDQIDDASAALILQLQREDADELQRLGKGKGREDAVSDADLALQVYQQELQQTGTVLADRSMSRSLARAVIADSAFLTNAVAREDAFANDRLVAERLDGGEEVDWGTEGCSEDPKLDDLFIARLTALYVSGIDDDCTSSVDNNQDSTTSESSQWAAARANISETTRHECVSCNEHKRPFESFQTPSNCFNDSKRRVSNFGRAIEHTALDLHAPPSLHQSTSLGSEQHATHASQKPAPSARATAMTVIALMIPLSRRYYKQRLSRDGNVVTIVDAWLN
ncbi:MAG: hypothetical protein Q9186_001121 [Xanthomendoza sp. 1 TL-2023]